MKGDLVANLLQPRSQTSEVGLIESKHSVGLKRTNVKHTAQSHSEKRCHVLGN